MNEFDKETGMYNVIDFGEFSIGRNRKTAISGKCQHPSIVLDDSTNRVLCKQCDEVLDPFWALNRIITKWSNFAASLDKQKKENEELLGTVIHLKAAKHIESLLRSRNVAPTCPHCTEPMFAEDILRMGKVSKEIAKAARARETT